MKIIFILIILVTSLSCSKKITSQASESLNSSESCLPTTNLDSDGDGIPDCMDECPNDPNKTKQGICGCGISDIDSDLDGIPDCMDECPNDVKKVKAGECGCGNIDTDYDNDGVYDCKDCSINPASGNMSLKGNSVCNDIDVWQGLHAINLELDGNISNFTFIASNGARNITLKEMLNLKMSASHSEITVNIPFNYSEFIFSTSGNVFYLEKDGYKIEGHQCAILKFKDQTLQTIISLDYSPFKLILGDVGSCGDTCVCE